MTRSSFLPSFVAVLSTFGVATMSLGCTGAVGEDAASSTANAISTQSIASIALANVGKGACSRNSAGSVAFESSCSGNGGQPEYWCADFAMWVWGQAGVTTSGLDAAVSSFRTYGLDHGTFHTSSPSVGDAVIFKSGGVDQHVAIVTQVNSNGTIETVSGDWGGASGSEAYFSSTSHVVLNAPAYSAAYGAYASVMGMSIDGFVSPVGGGSAPSAPSAPITPGAGCFATALNQEMPANACVQNTDSSWSQCDNGNWTDRWTDPTACSGVYPLGSVAVASGDDAGAADPTPPAPQPTSGTPCVTLGGNSMPDNACVQNSNGSWSQCDNGNWTDRWTDPDACNGTYPY